MLNFMKMVLRPGCRAASRSLTRTAFYHQSWSKSPQIIISPARRFLRTEVVENFAEEEQRISKFEVFRARALHKGRVGEREVEALLAEADAQLAFLLNCCADSLPHLPGPTRLHLASQIWTRFAEKEGYKVTKLDVLALLNVFSSAGQSVDLSELLPPTEASRFLRDRDVLLQLLDCHSEGANPTKCEETIDLLKSLGKTSGDAEFAALILAHGKSHNFERVESVLKAMEELEVPPGPLSLFALLRAQILNSQPVERTLKSMQGQSLPSSEEHMAKVILSLAEANNTKLVGPILRVFPVNGLSHCIRNMVIRLIHQDRHFFACNIYHLLLTNCNPEVLNSILAFFPTELVKSNKSAVDILEICISLQSNFPNHNSFLLYALEESLKDKSKGGLSGELLSHASPLRNHFFWPLIVHCGSPEEMVRVLNHMQSLGLRPDFDTLAFYVFPGMLRWDAPMAVLKLLQAECGLSVATQLGPMLNALLIDKHLQEALDLCKMINQRTLDLRKLTKSLSSAVLKKKSFGVAAHLVALLAESRHKFAEVDFVGLFLIEYCSRCSPADLKELLSHMAKFKVRMSMASYEGLLTKAAVKQIGIQYLDLLTNSTYSGLNTFQPIAHPRDMDVEELEAHLVELKSKSMNTRGVLRRLLQAHCRLKNVDRALQIKKEMDSLRFELSPGILSSLLSLYTEMEDVASATEILHQIQEYPRFALDWFKIVDFCRLKVRTGADFDEVSELLEQHIFQVRRSKRFSIDAHNCIKLLDEVKKSYGDQKRDLLLNKFSENEII
ncbi:leucine-rich PPR motif-containing protein, mitochondrial-like [Neocloeon triangulifer]|uniref:leucine-rich PPR motif-containing protein, mitochondrial-like n=1 Tax=Neocloeon triangulifer TaxID=2078957 RepID=UPI00286EB857|nr:leucine-rich PPR motif-containing protein, mitochondrial-like [Neocloeon triangulifer]